MIVSPENENRQTTFNCRQTTFLSPENHKPVLTALVPGNKSVKRLEFIVGKAVPILPAR